MPVLGWWALLLLVLVVTGAIGLTAFRYGLLPTLVGGAPYMPTNPDLVKAMIRLAGLKASDRVVDLGSGDGRFVLAAANAGVSEATGYEIDGWNVWNANREAKRLKLVNTRFVCRSFWTVSLREVDVVFVYGLPPYMARLAEKCAAELPSGARVVSLLYELPGWRSLKTQEGIHLYQKL